LGHIELFLLGQAALVELKRQTAKTAKNPLRKPISKVITKNRTLKAKDARAKYSARLEDTVIANSSPWTAEQETLKGSTYSIYASALQVRSYVL
jgi:hypothetical protein